MTVTYHPNGLPDSHDKRPCYHAVNPFPVGHLDAEVIYPVRNGDQLGALILAYQKHQDWLNSACDRGLLPSCMKARASASICTITSGLRVSLQRTALKNGESNFYPTFTITLSGKSGEFKKGAFRMFYPSKHGYKEAWEEAVMFYAADRMLSPEIERLLIALIPDPTIFVEYLAHFKGVTDPLDLKLFLGRLQPDRSLRSLDYKAYSQPHIIVTGLRGKINRITPTSVTLSFVVRTKSGSSRQSALLKYGYENAYRHAVDAFMEVHRDTVDEAVREQLLSMMPDKTVFSDYLIPMALREGSITKGESLKLLTDLKVS